MKQILIFVSVVVAIVVFIGVKTSLQSAAKNKQTEKIEQKGDKKVLTVYYSHSGNTRQIAEQIQNIVGGDIFEIKPSEPYPNDYNTLVKQAKQEKADDFRPQIQGKVPDIKSYDIIFLGTPVWWYTMASPVKTFLAENNLEGKTIVPFCTHGGGGASSTFTDMQKLALKAKVLNGFAIYESGSSKTLKDLSDWINKLNLK